uniref:Uncharacterized protein n=1 Tax=Ditylenchus dipsaci TaxID=166011 RepID=A0A915EDS2_9BILA
MAGHEDHSQHMHAHHEPSITSKNLTDLIANSPAFLNTTLSPVDTTATPLTTTVQHRDMRTMTITITNTMVWSKVVDCWLFGVGFTCRS